MEQQHLEAAAPPVESASIMITMLNTPVEVAPGFFFNLLAIWAGMSWLMGSKHPGWDWPTRILSGAFSGFALVVADFGHALA
ncbi:MAG TPA: hypothetical protein VMW34_02100, partial [Anaerolineales bacterium]|nr:hypothetical protein [Anaerolineales bacterium]